MAFSQSLIPVIIGQNWWDAFDYPNSIWDQHFGTVLAERDLYPSTWYRGYLLRPRTQAAVEASGQSEVKDEKDKFQIMLNVSLFKPNEIEVKVIDNFVVIHGKHEEQSDEHGFIKREFTRRYMLPNGAESETVESSLNENGILTIEVPKKAIEAPSPSEHVVPISLSKPEFEGEK